MNDLTVCLFTMERPNFTAFARRFGAIHAKTVHEFDGAEVPLPGGHERFLWQPYGLDIETYAALHPGYCNAVVPEQEAAALGLNAFVYGCPELYEMLTDVPDIRLIMPSYPWDILKFTKGEAVYGTYFHTEFDQQDSAYQLAVQDLGRATAHLAKKHDGIVWLNKNRANRHVRRWLEQGSRKPVMDLVREAK